MSRIRAPLAFASVSIDATRDTCVVFPRPSIHLLQHPSRCGRRRLEHLLCDMSVSTVLSEHWKNIGEWRGHHVSELHTRFQRCPLGRPQILNNMCTSACRTTWLVVFDVTFDVCSVYLGCNGFILHVKMNGCDIVADIVHVISYIDNTLCRQWLCQTLSCHRQRHMSHPVHTACLL